MKSSGTPHNPLQNALDLHSAGDLRAAETAFLAILADAPEQAIALHFLGIIGLQTSRFDVAADYLGKTVRLQPDNVDALINLGNAQQALRQHQAAIDSFEAALLLRPDSAAALANLGNAHRQLGRRAVAVGYLMRALNIDPTFSEARRNLADTLLDIGAAADALRHIRAAAKADRYSPSVKASLANILHANGEYEDALTTYESILAARPDFPPIMCNLASVLDDLGRTQEAIELLEKATRLDPNYAEGKYALGIALQHDGRNKAATDALHEALLIDPYCAKAWRALASLSTNRSITATRNGIGRALALPDLTSEQRLQLEFAAGKCDEDAGDFVGAAHHIEIANRLHRANIDYTPKDDLDKFADIKRKFDREFVLRRGNVGNDNATPIFIVGMPRSGTSLVEQILASHPHVHGGGELLYFPQAVASQRHLNSEIAEDYLSKLRTLNTNAKHVTDKLPANFLHIGIIRMLLPRARIIHCVRDSRDNCWSIYKHFFGAGGYRYAYELTELGNYYRGYEDLMVHWHDVLPGVVHDVRYEDLVQDQENTTRALLDACDLPWDPACLNFHRTQRSVRTLSASQVRMPVYNKSVGSWKSVKHAIAPLLAILDN